MASLPCLVCGRTPCHAHHLRFIQQRSLGSKPSDEWAVPLCPIHHRSLHDTGLEEEWWQAKGINAKAEAERLWIKTHRTEPIAPSTATAARESEREPEGRELNGREVEDQVALNSESSEVEVPSP